MTVQGVSQAVSQGVSQALPQFSDSAIADTIAAVFRARAYTDRQQPWLLQKLEDWAHALWNLLVRLFHPIGEAARASTVVRVLMIAVLTLAVGAVIGRLLYGAYLRRGRAAGAGRSRGDARLGGRPGDAWAAAQGHAARGEFTEAAHALYAALLDAAARQGQLSLHPSKTAGDYVRELRTRSSALFGRFRDFARSYEVVIYGIGSCDRERYERLHALALPIVRPDA
ncbi:MAG: DUF4129 domain-containing protein [Gemmatimonadaceae bacterium]